MRWLGLTIVCVTALGCGGLSGRDQSDGMGAASAGGGAGGTGGRGSGGQGGGDTTVTCSEGSSRAGDVRLASQSDVAALGGVSQVEGSIHITGEVTDLGPLRCLRQVTGNLSVYEAELLRSLSGLDGLQAIDGALLIGTSCDKEEDQCVGNPALEAVAALGNLERATHVIIGSHCGGEGGSPCGPNSALTRVELTKLAAVQTLSISANPKLSQMHFEALTEVGTLEVSSNPELYAIEVPQLRRVERLSIRYSQALGEIVAGDGISEVNNVEVVYSGLPDLSWLGARYVTKLAISSNSQLVSLRGLERLEAAGSLSLNNNGALSTLDGLGALRTIETELRIVSMPLLETLSGLDQLETVDHLFVESNQALSDLVGLGSLTSLGKLNVTDNQKLSSLQGLDSLAELGTLSISNNDVLVNLRGLEGVVVRWVLGIGDNDELVSLEGLQTTTELSSFGFDGNARLSDLGGLARVTRVVDGVGIWRNPALHSLAGLAGLAAVGSLSIGQNEGLVELGLESLESVEYALTIRENPALPDLQGLDALTRVGSLLIQDNLALESVDGLGSLVTADYEIQISGNSVLSSLAGLGNVDEAGRLLIWYNPSLPTCEAAWLADEIGISNVSISGNDDAGVCER
jgi:hypothetical protein